MSKTSYPAPVIAEAARGVRLAMAGELARSYLALRGAQHELEARRAAIAAATAAVRTPRRPCTPRASWTARLIATLRIFDQTLTRSFAGASRCSECRVLP